MSYLNEIDNSVVMKFNGKIQLMNKERLIASSAASAAAFGGNYANTITNNYEIEGYSKEAVILLLKFIRNDNSTPEFWDRYEYGRIDP